MELTPQQIAARLAYRQFVEREICPHAAQWDSEQRISERLLAAYAAEGYWGAVLPREHGGSELDLVTFGLMHEELGRGCGSARSLLTPHVMVGQALLRWGTPAQRERWLPRLATGELRGAFCVSEAGVGSDAGGVETMAEASGEGWLLRGAKRWVTGGQTAGLFLVLGKANGKLTTFLVERDQPGVNVTAFTGLLGLRAAMVADVRFEGVRLGEEHVLGGLGVGFPHVVGHALEFGKLSVAWGCVGIARACLDASVTHASRRRQFGVLLREQPLVRQLLTQMIVNQDAARLLCLRASRRLEARDSAALQATAAAKYFASRIAMQAAADAVQIHGAAGCEAAAPVQRHFRDAKIMELIEGTTQVHENSIPGYGYE
jgi:hypothetical protein